MSMFFTGKRSPGDQRPWVLRDEGQYLPEYRADRLDDGRFDIKRDGDQLCRVASEEHAKRIIDYFVRNDVSVQIAIHWFCNDQQELYMDWITRVKERTA